MGAFIKELVTYLVLFTFPERPRNNKVLDNEALQQITIDEMQRQREMARAKTAPSARERRRNWKVDSSVEIKTTQGGAKIKAPGEKVLNI